MARPRNNANTPNAKQRILDSFWELLEENTLHEISVGMIAAKANCNRGTFYYHFSDIDHLIDSAVDEDLLRGNEMTSYLFNVLAGLPTSRPALEAVEKRVYRTCLLMTKGDSTVFYKKFLNVSLTLWRAVLCPGRESLKKETVYMLKYATSGLLGVISDSFESNPERFNANEVFENEFFKNHTRFLISQYCKSEGITEIEALERLKAINHFLSTTRR